LSAAALWALFLILLSGTAHATGDSTLMKQITETITKVRTGRTLDSRAGVAQHLADLTEKVDPKEVDDKTLADMVNLLSTRDDSVRAWTAVAIGHLGPRARPAAPALLNLLPEVDGLRGELTSAPAVRLALERIGIKPPPPQPCGSRGR
jgi:Fe-S-cluster formation regulator IscX/YfhJ